LVDDLQKSWNLFYDAIMENAQKIMVLGLPHDTNRRQSKNPKHQANLDITSQRVLESQDYDTGTAPQAHSTSEQRECRFNKHQIKSNGTE